PGLRYRLTGFLGAADNDQTPIRAGDTPLYENHILIFKDFDDLQVLHGATNVTHMTRHLFALENFTRCLAHTNGTNTTVHHVTVRGWLPIKIVALDDTLETTTFNSR